MFDFKNVKAIIFDFGGVIINLNRQASVDKLIELGVKDADSMLDNYVQSGLFAQLEAGEINADQFHNLLREKYQLSLSDEVIDDAFYSLKSGGRLAVITFHSLEDRLVKQRFAGWCRGCTCPPDFPVCVCGKTPDVKLINKKPILPTEREVEENPRARSAKLRVAEKLKDPT